MCNQYARVEKHRSDSQLLESLVGRPAPYGFLPLGPVGSVGKYARCCKYGCPCLRLCIPGLQGAVQNLPNHLCLGHAPAAGKLLYPLRLFFRNVDLRTLHMAAVYITTLMLGRHRIGDAPTVRTDVPEPAITESSVTLVWNQVPNCSGVLARDRSAQPYEVKVTMVAWICSVATRTRRTMTSECGWLKKTASTAGAGGPRRS